jgi:molybdopterin-binding protein
LVIPATGNGQVRARGEAIQTTRDQEEEEMKLSARNMLRGKVKKMDPGAVNTEVVIELAGGQEVVSIITKRSADDLGLKVGKEVVAVIKASSVMIAVD